MGELFFGSFAAALNMIASGDAQLWSIVLLSLRCTFIACVGACVIGVPLAFALATGEFFGKRGIILLFSTLQALPTVVVGLFLYVFISRRGVFGVFDLLYSPTAITIGQLILILPLVTMFLIAALARLDKRYRETALTLGATNWQAAIAVMREARFATVAALCTAFGRGISEVGVSMMLGGNIKGATRTMTTAMALEYDKGEFTLAMALGIVLLLVSLVLNVGLSFVQGKMEN